MIIHQPELFTHEGHTILWAKVELAQKRDHFPEYLWYRVPNRYLGSLALHGDAFLVPGLLAGMNLGEDIDVRGPVSARLAYSLEEYQFLLSMRFPGYLQMVDINYRQIEPLAEMPQGVGTSFSGGVDSMFTLWKHLPDNQPDPDYQITHAVFIKGFDLIHTEEQYYWMLFDEYEKHLTEIGIELIPLETNIVSLRHLRTPASYLFGPTICGAGLSLARSFHTFFVPSSWDYSALSKKKYSSDPWVDRLLSTDHLRIIHHGADFHRVEKVEEIADWEIAREILWVCIEYKFEKQGWNCSRCEKCVRTMIPLFALGKLDKFKTFARPLHTNRDSLRWIRKFSLRHDFLSEMFPFVSKHKRDLLPWLWVAAFFGMIRYRLVEGLPQFAKRWLRRYGYYVTHNEARDAYEMPEVTRLIESRDDHPST
jgi:hypothetical protein